MPEKKRVLVLGAAGMLGHRMVRELAPAFDVCAAFRGDAAPAGGDPFFADATKMYGLRADEFSTVERAVRDFVPHVVVNCIGVVKQLPSAQDVVGTLSVNSIFPNLLERLSAGLDDPFRLIHFSTDCVFAGTRGNYAESNLPDAYDLYGQSKRFGEVGGPHSLTIRTSIIGRELGSGHSLVEWFLAQRAKGATKGFSRAVFSGFPTAVMAGIVAWILQEKPGLSGLYHVSSDPIDKFTLLTLVNDAFGAGVAIDRDDEFAIDRSLDSSRFRAATGFAPRPWPEMVGELLRDNEIYESLKK